MPFVETKFYACNEDTEAFGSKCKFNSNQKRQGHNKDLVRSQAEVEKTCSETGRRGEQAKGQNMVK